MLWTRTLTLSPGPNLISVVASDDSPARNSAARSITLVYEPEDRTPPDLEIGSHRDGQNVLSVSIMLTGTTTDADRGDDGISSVVVNGSAATGGTATGANQAIWSKVLDLIPGRNVISVLAQDDSPARNIVTRTLVLVHDPGSADPAPGFCWANRAGGQGTDEAYSIALDSEGNSFVTGLFTGDALFGSTNLTSRGLSDVFVIKYTPSGELVWARQAGGALDDAGFGIAVDSDGNCYVTGYFSDQAAFDRTDLRTTGTFDLFLAKYGREGNLLWATNTGRGSGIFASAVAVDAAGNAHLTGSFAFDPLFGDTTFPNNEFYDAFVAKYDPDGNLLWATQAGGEGTDHGNGIAVDPLTGRCFVAGSFEGNAFFGSDDLVTSIGDSDAFIIQLDPDGELRWVRQGGAFGETLATSVCVDRNGNGLVAGRYDSLAIFEETLLSSDGFYDLFLSKYDGEGDLVWARATETSNAIDARAVATDQAGNAYLTGYFVGSARFGDTTLTNDSLSDIFVAKVDADGAFVWANQAGGESASSGWAIAVDAAGTCRVTGSTTGLARFGDRTVDGGLEADVFVAVLSGAAIGPATQLTILATSVREIRIQFVADSCSTYRLQVSDDLRRWSTVLTTNAPNGQVVHIEDNPPERREQFFRVLSP